MKHNSKILSTLLMVLFCSTVVAELPMMNNMNVPKRVITEKDTIVVNQQDRVTLALPYFPLENEEFNYKINSIINYHISPLMYYFIELAYEYKHEHEYFQNWSFEIVFHSKEVLSLKIRQDEYTGGAHANTFFKTYNIDLNSMMNKGIEDYFQNIDLEKLSNYCANEHKEKSLIFDLVTEEDYKYLIKNWNYTKGGLLLTFEPYQVGPYSQGITDIFITNEDLEKLK